MQVWPLNVEVWRDGGTSDTQRNVFVPSPSHFTGPELNTERIFHSAGSKGSVSFEPPCCLSLPCGWRKLKQGPINWLHSHSACPLPFVLTTETPLLKEASDYFIRTNKRLDEAWCDSWIIHWVYVKGDNSFDSFFCTKDCTPVNAMEIFCQQKAPWVCCTCHTGRKQWRSQRRDSRIVQTFHSFHLISFAIDIMKRPVSAWQRQTQTANKLDS